jgi:hypothetical protein
MTASFRTVEDYFHEIICRDKILSEAGPLFQLRRRASADKKRSLCFHGPSAACREATLFCEQTIRLIETPERAANPIGPKQAPDRRLVGCGRSSGGSAKARAARRVSISS